MRQAITHLSRDPTAPQSDLLSPSIAAVDLASLLVRLARERRRERAHR